jgi:hypothetical protein
MCRYWNREVPFAICFNYFFISSCKYARSVRLKFIGKLFDVSERMSNECFAFKAVCFGMVAPSFFALCTYKVFAVDINALARLLLIAYSIH